MRAVVKLDIRNSQSYRVEYRDLDCEHENTPGTSFFFICLNEIFREIISLINLFFIKTESQNKFHYLESVSTKKAPTFTVFHRGLLVEPSGKRAKPKLFQPEKVKTHFLGEHVSAHDTPRKQFTLARFAVARGEKRVSTVYPALSATKTEMKNEGACLACCTAAAVNNQGISSAHKSRAS